MKRITKHIGADKVCYAICEKDCPDGIYADNPACMCTASMQAQKRLMEYEDTGLTPQEIMELKERDSEKIIHADKVTRIGKFGNCPRCGRRLRDQDCAVFCGSCGQRLKWED